MNPTPGDRGRNAAVLPARHHKLDGSHGSHQPGTRVLLYKHSRVCREGGTYRRAWIVQGSVPA